MSMLRFKVLSVCMLCIAHISFAQLKKAKTFTTDQTITFAAVDRPGEVYLVSASNQVQKLDNNGTLLNSFKYDYAPKIFDPRDGSRLFVFFNHQNEYTFLSPSLSLLTSPRQIDSALAIHPYLICPSGDYNLVLIDSADWSLKKINSKNNSLIWETLLPDSLQNDVRFNYIRDYQSFIFILDQRKGILIFNSIGKLLRNIPVRDLPYFNFIGEELYYPSKKNELTFFNLFTAETRTMALPTEADFSLLTDERLFLIVKNKVDIYNISP